MRILLGVTVGMMLASAALAGKRGSAPDDQKAPDVDFLALDAQAKVELLTLTLDKAEGGGALTMFIWLRGGKPRQAWAIAANAPAYCWPLMAAAAGFYDLPKDCGLSIEAGKLNGVVYRGAQQKYVLAGTVNAGTFKGPAGEGSYTGRLVGEAEFAKQNPKPKADYPCWRNDGSGTGGETGAKLVSDSGQIRVLWKSEELIPPGYHEGINFPSPCGIQSGHCSPVLADGKVFLSYFTGSAKNMDAAGVEEMWPNSGFIPKEMVIKKSTHLADQIIVAMDAQSGRTLWKTVFAEDGPNISRGGSGSRHKLYGPSSKAASHLTQCAAYGKVFAKGTGNVVYAVDADTGKLVWRTEPWKQPEKGQFNTGTDTVTFADGVVATMSGGGLTGFEAATGKVLWKLPAGLGRGQTAIRWVTKGREFFLTPKGQCIEPKTGKVLWTAEGAPGGGVIAADGSHLLCSGSSIVGFAISPEKATLLWTVEGEYSPREITPVIYKGHAYLRAMNKVDKDAGKYQSICVELATGKVVSKAEGTKSFSSITCGDGLIFNSNAALVMLQPANPQDFHQLKAGGNLPKNTVADVAMPIIIQGSPEVTAIYADGRVFSRCFDGIICYDLRRP
jgi:outer membrane protein assembly factor BamB